MAENFLHLSRSPAPRMSVNLHDKPVPVPQIPPLKSCLHRLSWPARDGSIRRNGQIAECQCHGTRSFQVKWRSGGGDQRGGLNWRGVMLVQVTHYGEFGSVVDLLVEAVEHECGLGTLGVFVSDGA